MQATAPPGSLGAKTVPGPSPTSGTTATPPVAAAKGVYAPGGGEGVQAEGSELRRALSGVVEGALEAVDPGREQVGEVGDETGGCSGVVVVGRVIQETASGQSLHEMDVEGREGGGVRHAVSDMMHRASQAAEAAVHVMGDVAFKALRMAVVDVPGESGNAAAAGRAGGAPGAGAEEEEGEEEGPLGEDLWYQIPQALAYLGEADTKVAVLGSPQPYISPALRGLAPALPTPVPVTESEAQAAEARLREDLTADEGESSEEESGQRRRGAGGGRGGLPEEAGAGVGITTTPTVGLPGAPGQEATVPDAGEEEAEGEEAFPPGPYISASLRGFSPALPTPVPVSEAAARAAEQRLRGESDISEEEGEGGEEPVLAEPHPVAEPVPTEPPAAAVEEEEPEEEEDDGEGEGTGGPFISPSLRGLAPPLPQPTPVSEAEARAAQQRLRIGLSPSEVRLQQLSLEDDEGEEEEGGAAGGAEPPTRPPGEGTSIGLVRVGQPAAGTKGAAPAGIAGTARGPLSGSAGEEEGPGGTSGYESDEDVRGAVLDIEGEEVHHHQQQSPVVAVAGLPPSKGVAGAPVDESSDYPARSAQRLAAGGAPHIPSSRDSAADAADAQDRAKALEEELLGDEPGALGLPGGSPRGDPEGSGSGGAPGEDKGVLTRAREAAEVMATTAVETAKEVAATVTGTTADQKADKAPAVQLADLAQSIRQMEEERAGDVAYQTAVRNLEASAAQAPAP
ncbi:hypothetical protein N2152v2_003106 [Parachlorella kessleri]